VQTWWAPITLAEGKTHTVRIGTLQLWLRRAGDEWAFNWDRYGESSEHSLQPEGPEVLPAPATWHRVIAPEAGDTLQLLPSPPDRPLMVSPHQPLSIARDVRTNLYIYLPCWVRVTVGKPEKRLTLMEAPSVELTRSWFGDYKRGKLCYSWETAAVRDWQQMRPRPHHLLGTLQLHNRASKGMLRFTRFCLYPQPMAVYADETRLWTSIVRVTWHGSGEYSELDYHTEAPRELPGPPIGRPRVADAESILGRLAGIRVFFSG